MAYDGLRAFVETLEREDAAAGTTELVRVRREVDPYLEIAEIADRTMKGGGPALLFENVKGSRFPLLINAYGSRRRMSRALGVEDLEEHARTIGELVHARAPKSARELAEMAGRLPALAAAVPLRVTTAACQEVVALGDDVDLMTLPVTTCWPDDGGPFFTLPNVITNDPDTGARNIGMYRMQRIDRRTTAMHWQIHETGARHFRRAKEHGKRLEVAVAFGGDPALTYAATAPLPDGIDEWMFAGFLRGKPVEHVRCKTVDLEVPADADFVLEGYVDPSEELFAEGPFGDHTGYYTPVDAFPRFHVTAITHRKNAVYPATLVGRPPMEERWLATATERLFLHKSAWPQVATQSKGVKAHVDAIWAELGIPLGDASAQASASAQARTNGKAKANESAPVARLDARKDAPQHASANRAMFDRIAPTYDILNKLMSFGIDKRWRNKAIAALGRSGDRVGPVLDLCAGTLDLSALLEQAFPTERIVACDFSANMLERGKDKVTRTERVVGDALALPFDAATFGAIICGFGMRNLADLRAGVREARRVLRPGGTFVTLELFAPKLLRTRALHTAALKSALPVLGAVVARDRDAYAYLAESMAGFVTREQYETILREEGFETVSASDLTMGVAAIVKGTASNQPTAHVNVTGKSARRASGEVLA
jgi:UbiD family decarboxylase/ubiquinone/menaquinone biosynthesis methyltransferase